MAGGALAGLDITSNEASIYDPRSGTMESTGLLAISRQDHTDTLLPTVTS